MTFWQIFWTTLAFLLIVVETNLSRDERGWGSYKWIWMWVIAFWIIDRAVAS